MSELVNEALEVDALIIGKTIQDTFGIFSGDDLPHVAVPDAPANSIYYRSNGEEYKLSFTMDGAIQNNWVLQKWVSSDVVNSIVEMSQASYDLSSPYDSSTLYLITS